MNESELIIIGANGQLGQALQIKYPGAQAVDYDSLDITDWTALENFDWTALKVILNVAAYTNVDGAETADGRVAAWRVNALAPAYLSKIARLHSLKLIHISTDYVFDGTKDNHTEDESFSPLSVYGASKAAGDIAVGTIDEHYILRTSWVIGEGNNFVRTMLALGKKGVNPAVVADQIGRLTFTTELVRAIDYLLTNNAKYGTYNVSNDGEAMSWADITRKIFGVADYKLTVSDVTTKDYYEGRVGIAPRPLKSSLDLKKLHDIGFKSTGWGEDLATYIKKEGV